MRVDIYNLDLYDCFKRTWWIDNPDWPNGLEPCAGEKDFYFKNAVGSETIAFYTEEEAIEYCREYNNTHDAGRYSYKAEYQLRINSEII